MKIDCTSKLRVLLVDDTQVHRSLMGAGMEVFDPFISIDQASNLDEAINKLHDNTYNAVISNWCTPGCRGKELVRWMRTRAAYGRTAFIVISASIAGDTVSVALTQDGVDGCIAKPFKRRDLFDTMMSAVQKRRAGSAYDLESLDGKPY
jgi:DNA-binding response OmpR family regulator